MIIKKCSNIRGTETEIFRSAALCDSYQKLKICALLMQ